MGWTKDESRWVTTDQQPSGAVAEKEDTLPLMCSLSIEVRSSFKLSNLSNPLNQDPILK